MTQKLLAKLQSHLDNINSGRISEAVHEFGPMASLVETYVLSTMGEDSPFLKEVVRARQIRHAGVVGKSLTQGEYRHKYEALQGIVRLVNEARNLLRDDD